MHKKLKKKFLNFFPTNTQKNLEKFCQIFRKKFKCWYGKKIKFFFDFFFHFRKFLAFLAKIFLTFMTLTFHPKVIIGFPENLPSAADIPVSTDTLVCIEPLFSMSLKYIPCHLLLIQIN